MNLLTRAGYFFFLPPLAFPFTHQIGFMSSKNGSIGPKKSHAKIENEEKLPNWQLKSVRVAKNNESH